MEKPENSDFAMVAGSPGAPKAAACSHVVQCLGRIVKRFGLADRFLLVAIAAGLLLGAQGLGWGKYDCLNVDAMAFRTIFASSRPPGHPGSFLKPPFYTYVNHVVARLPAQVISGAIVWKGGKARDDLYFQLRLFFARCLNLAMFALSTVLIFAMVRDFHGLTAARVAALLFATCAGFVVYQVFLTVDLALVFMMLAALAGAAAIVRHPGVGISVAAGLLAGLATATKYNGLAVAAALPVAHLLASRGNPILACLKRPAAWLCGLAVPVGFLIGNPYAVLDWPKFRADFVYNYETTPVYNGVTEGTGYAKFIATFPELLGWPALVILALGVVASLVVLGSSGPRRDGWKLTLLALSVFALYFWKMGEFPRVPTRFVLPMVPLLILIAAGGFAVLFKARWFAAPVVASVLVYNVVCGVWIGSAFREDPRMKLIPVVRDAAQGPTTIEVSKSIPVLHKMADRDIRRIEMPGAIQRGRIFDTIFAGREDMQEFRSRWQSDAGPEWFSAEQRAKRNPDLVIWCENDVETPTRPYFEALLRPDSPYQVIFDQFSPVRPAWVYPSRPDFVPNRTVVLKKK